jgi:hypothetical protein
LLLFLLISVLDNYWDSVKNRRELYERFALAKGVNPLDPNFWYNLNAEELRKFRVFKCMNKHKIPEKIPKNSKKFQKNSKKIPKNQIYGVGIWNLESLRSLM